MAAVVSQERDEGGETRVLAEEDRERVGFQTNSEGTTARLAEGRGKPEKMLRDDSMVIHRWPEQQAT